MIGLTVAVIGWLYFFGGRSGARQFIAACNWRLTPASRRPADDVRPGLEVVMRVFVQFMGRDPRDVRFTMLSVGIVTAEVSEKHSELDWTDDELVALLNERRESREGAARSEDGESESDSVQ